MAGDLDTAYLAGLAADQRAGLERVNAPGWAALGGYLKSGQAVAFLGAVASAPLYPLWTGLIGELVDAAADGLSPAEAATCRELASSSPDAVVEIVRRSLGAGVYREVLRQVLRARSDPVTGRSWTDVQELVCRCAFHGVVTTNYDPGIVNARMRVRPGASGTGFTTWEDELGLDRWRTGDVFGEDELPVLFAHGQHNRPDTVVLATTEYRRAYAGKLPRVLARLLDGHVCWIGFSFTDQRIGAILREIAEQTGTRADPGTAPRHVAVMPWDPAAAGNDPQVLAQQAEIDYGARVILYPAPGGDHSALAAVLAKLADARFPAVVYVPARPTREMAAPRADAAASAAQTATTTPTDESDRLHGQHHDIEAEHRQSARPDPARAADHYGRAGNRLRRGARRLTDYREAVRLDPGNAGYHYALAGKLRDAGKPAEAEAEYWEAVRLDPGNAGYHYALAGKLRDAGRPAEAEAEYWEAVRLDPGNAGYHYALAGKLRDAGKPAEAEAEYWEAVRLDPGNAGYHYALAGKLRDAGRPAEAEAEYREAIRLDPRNASPHYTLGLLLREAKRLPAAEAEYREATRLDPGNRAYRYALDSLTREAKRLPKRR